MNAKLEQYCNNNRLEVIGNVGYGTYNGYEMNIAYYALDNVTPIHIHISFYANVQDKKTIYQRVVQQKVKYLKVELDEFGLKLGLNGFTLNSILNNLNNTLDLITDIIKEYNGKNLEYCPVCGKEFSEEAKVYDVRDIKVKLNPECVTNINEAIEEGNKNFEEAPNNYGKGIVGLLLGALIGAISYVILFMLGFISAISAFLSIMLGAFFYKKFGGKPNKIMVILAAVITVISLVLTVFILYVNAAGLLASEFGFTTSGIAAFTDMMTVSEFSAEFTANLLMTVLFTALGAGYEVYNLSKSVKRVKKINK